MTEMVVVACLSAGCGLGALDGLSGGDSVDLPEGVGGAAGGDASPPGSGGSGASHTDASADSRGGAGSSGDGAAGAAGTAGGDGAPANVDAEADAVDDSAGPEVAAPDACPFEMDLELCARMRKNCDTLTAPDRCGLSRQVVCGTCAAPSSCGGGGTLNVCSGGGPVNRAQGGVVTSSRAADHADESPAHVFDNNSGTKWYCRAPTPWIAYQFPAGASYAINAYTVTSANDQPARDPKSWQLLGSNDGGANWTLLDSRVNETFANRFQTNAYSFANTTPYSAYRFVVTANAGGAQFQVAEIQLFDSPGPGLDGGTAD